MTAGNACIVSMTTIIELSVLPPRYPATRPIRRPITSAAATPGSATLMRYTHAVDQTREQISAELVGSEQVIPGGTLETVLDVLLGGIVRRDERREDREDDRARR